METRYAFVARELTEAIARGRYPVGSLLPNEIDLAEQFSVSRSTVRAAMRELQAMGLVSRKKSAGTRVEATSAQRAGGAFAQSLSSIEAIQQFGVETERDVQEISETVADAGLATKLGCKPGSRWLRVSSLRRVPGDRGAPPVCWTDVYIDASLSQQIAPQLKQYRGIFGDLIETITGRRIVEIRQDIAACGLPAHIAGPLATKPGDHALEIRRQYILSPGSLVEVSVSYHPADRFQYSTRLTRQEAG
ncbi:GntR family transcriptional regulator [Bradyrhizobium erythrophlei]|uniref:GntR family transcriptional regulator n=1 Tax=Bradyrhizobium erythrophlei TaxID=1437360 RepID=UPI0035EF6B0D